MEQDKKLEVNPIFKAASWGIWAQYLPAGVQGMLRTQDQINDLKAELSGIIGPDETERVYDQVKNEAYGQGSPNGMYILNKMFQIVAKAKK